MTQAAEVFDLIERCGDETQIREAIEYAVCTLSLSEFVYHGWPILHEEEPIGWNWHIDCICDHLTAALAGDIAWLLINVPPGMAKSLLCSVYFPAWAWLKKPWIKFLCSGVNEVITLRDARKHRQVIEHPWYRRVFAPEWTISRTQAADGNFGNTRNGERVSRTVRSSIIGMRPHVRILDDPNDPDKVNSEEFQKTNSWLETTLLKRRARIDSPLIVVQQRLHEQDVTGYLLSREGNPELVHLIMPNRYEKGRTFSTPVVNPETSEPWQDPRTEDDELLFPLILDDKTTAAEIANDPTVDAAQNQQNPTPPGGIIFRRDAFRRWSINPTIDRWPVVKLPDFEHGDFPTYPLPEFDYEIITVDLNNLKEGQKATKHTDWCVFDVWGRAAKDYYLAEQIREKFGVSAAIQALVQLIKARGDRKPSKLACVLIESKANGPTVIASTRAIMNIAHEEKHPKHLQFIRPWDVQGEDKTQRAKAVAYVPEEGRVYIPSEHEYGWVRAGWLPEVTGFPAKTFDDRVDTATMAWSFFEKDRQFG